MIPIAIQEIHDWLRLPQHTNEFVIVYVNDETSDSDWGKIDLIQNPVNTTFKDIIFTPSIKSKLYPNRWFVPLIKCVYTANIYSLT